MTEKFNQQQYQNDWNKKNMKSVGAQYKSEFVDEFKAALKVLNIKQSQVIRDAMQATIDKANKEKQKNTPTHEE